MVTAKENVSFYKYFFVRCLSEHRRRHQHFFLRVFVLLLAVENVTANHPPQFLTGAQTEIILRLKEGADNPVGKYDVITLFKGKSSIAPRLSVVKSRYVSHAVPLSVESIAHSHNTGT